MDKVDNQKIIFDRRREFYNALRSDDYAQCRYRLKDGDSFCCLGVACDVSGLGQWDAGGRYIIDQFDGDEVVGEGSLPSPVAEYFDFRSDDPLLISDTATALNDNHRKTFKEIADEFQQRYPCG